MANSCEHGDEPLGLIKDGGYDWLRVLSASEGLRCMQSVT
jgi:hypothetical protein